MATNSDSPKKNANGMQRLFARLTAAKRPAMTLCAILALSLPTAACFEATRTTVTGTGGNKRVNEQKARCAGWSRIKYDGTNDTFETIWQVRVHNALGRKKRCWK